MDVDQLLREASLRSPEARAKLAGQLISSLGDAEPEADRDVAWAAEIRRRLDEYDAGQDVVVPAEQLLADLKAIASGRDS